MAMKCGYDLANVNEEMGGFVVVGDVLFCVNWIYLRVHI